MSAYNNRSGSHRPVDDVAERRSAATGMSAASRAEDTALRDYVTESTLVVAQRRSIEACFGSVFPQRAAAHEQDLPLQARMATTVSDAPVQRSGKEQDMPGLAASDDEEAEESDEEDYDDYDDYDDQYDKLSDGSRKSARAQGSGGSGGVGTTKRQGGKNVRDKWYGSFAHNPEAQEWWHRDGKAKNGGGDMLSAKHAKLMFEKYLASKK